MHSLVKSCELLQQRGLVSRWQDSDQVFTLCAQSAAPKLRETEAAGSGHPSAAGTDLWISEPESGI